MKNVRGASTPGAEDRGTADVETPRPAARPALPEAAEAPCGTRDRVARSILDHGPSTAADLARRLDLTAAAVRRHLDALVADGLVEPREQRVHGGRGRGRPARVFALTDGGRDAFYQAYDQLAADALRWIAHSAGGGAGGDAAVAAFARARFAAQAERYRAVMETADPAHRARALAEALTADGYAATARSAPAPGAGRPTPPAGEQLCQHHCPVVHIAEQFPQLCEAETEAFSQLLGTHVQRLATIAHGDGVCTTFVPAPQARSAVPGPPQTDHPPPTDSPDRPTGAAPPASGATPTATARTSGRNPA